MSLLKCVLALSLLALLSGCGGLQDRLVGEWKGDAVEPSAQTEAQTEEGDAAAMGKALAEMFSQANLELSLRADGTFALVCDVPGLPRIEGSWSVEGRTVELDANPPVKDWQLAVSKDEQTLEDTPSGLVYHRVKAP